MDRQEIFNKTYQWFSRPGAELAKRFHGDGGTHEGETNCFYRHPEDDSRRCALGCQIPDEIYEREMEGMSSDILLHTYSEIADLFGVDYSKEEDEEEELAADEDFLCDLQCCHDHAHTTADALEAFRRFAADKGLTIPA